MAVLLQDVMRQTLTRHAKGLLLNAFSSWRDHTASQLQRKEQLCQCVQRIAAVRQRAVLLGWFAASSRQAILQRKLVTFVW